MNASVGAPAASRGYEGCYGRWAGGWWIPWAVFGGVLAAVAGVWLLQGLGLVRLGGGTPDGPVVGWPLFPFGFLLAAFLLFGVFRFGRWGGWRWGDRGYPPSAREIVDERYARGEISNDQRRQILRDLDESA